jgi:RNA polymerase sigma factor (TIGR02999 family)
MADDLQTQVTTVLDEIRAGQQAARARLVALVYDQLHQIAADLMRHERPGHTLTPTALVHEAFLKLLNEEALARAENLTYFYAAAAKAMRQILVDHARQRQAIQPGTASQRVPLDEVLEVFEKPGVNVLGLHDALEQLAQLHQRQSEVVTLRFFGGMTPAQVAEQLEVSVPLVESDWRKATAFLRKYLGPGA